MSRNIRRPRRSAGLLYSHAPGSTVPKSSFGLQYCCSRPLICPLAKAFRTKPLYPRPACPAADRVHRIAGRCLKWLRVLPRLTLWGLQSAERKKCYSSALTAFRGKCSVKLSAPIQRGMIAVDCFKRNTHTSGAICKSDYI